MPHNITHSPNTDLLHWGIGLTDFVRFQQNTAGLSNAHSQWTHCDPSGQSVAKVRTRRITFAVGTLGGLILGMVGVRVHNPLIEFDPQKWSDFQEISFHSCDVNLTAGVLAGGASGVHQIVSVFGDFTDKTRKNVNLG